MKIKDITQETADAFCSAMCSQFSARIARKSQAIEMKVVGTLFDLARLVGINVPAGHDFERFATTLGPMIYLPDGLTPEQTVEIVTHECQHVRQFWTRGFEFLWLYLVEPEARVRHEAEAYGAGLSVQHALTGTMPTLDDIVLPLEGGYSLAPEHVALGRLLLEQQATAIADGIVTTEAGSAALKWLRSHGVVT